MADDDLLSNLKSFFSPGDMSDPRVNSALRQQLALKMMSQRKGYPKTVGEGLTAIGDSLGDIGMSRQLARADLAAQAVQPPAATAAAALPPAVAGALNYAPEDGGGDYQPAPQQAPPEQAAQPSVFDTGAPPVAGLPGAGGQPPPVQPPPAETYTPPSPEQTGAARNALAAQLLARRGAAGGPPPNPLLAGAVPASISTAAPSPSPEPGPGSQPDPRLALNVPQDARGAVTDIRPAPPVPQTIARPPVQLAQAEQQYPAGYVPPQPGTPQGAPIIPMSPREIQLNRWLAANQGNPYAAMKVAPELGALQAARTTRQNEANETFKAQLLRDTEQAKLRLQAQIDQQKRISDIAHTQAQTRKENIVENPEDKYMMGPDGVVRPIKVEGEDPNAMPSGKLTEDQRKTLVYHGWAKMGNQAITGNDQLLAHGLYQETLGKLPIFGNAAQQEAYRQAKNGADNFILAFMRSTSGAQYGATERLDHAKAMLPKYGDDARTLADKANQRQQFVDSEYAGLGKQGQKMADYLEKKHDPAGGERRQQLIDIEMQGIKGGQVGEVKTNRKTGEQRMWNGSRWVETR